MPARGRARMTPGRRGLLLLMVLSELVKTQSLPNARAELAEVRVTGLAATSRGKLLRHVRRPRELRCSLF